MFLFNFITKLLILDMSIDPLTFTEQGFCVCIGFTFLYFAFFEYQYRFLKGNLALTYILILLSAFQHRFYRLICYVESKHVLSFNSDAKHFQKRLLQKQILTQFVL